MPHENEIGKLMLKRSGENMPLLRYFLKHGSLEFMTDLQIQMLCFMMKLKPEKFKEAKVGTTSRLTLACALIKTQKSGNMKAYFSSSS